MEILKVLFKNTPKEKFSLTNYSFFVSGLIEILGEINILNKTFFNDLKLSFEFIKVDFINQINNFRTHNSSNQNDAQIKEMGEKLYKLLMTIHFDRENKTRKNFWLHLTSLRSMFNPYKFIFESFVPVFSSNTVDLFPYEVVPLDFKIRKDFYRKVHFEVIGKYLSNYYSDLFFLILENQRENKDLLLCLHKIASEWNLFYLPSEESFQPQLNLNSFTTIDKEFVQKLTKDTSLINNVLTEKKNEIIQTINKNQSVNCDFIFDENGIILSAKMGYLDCKTEHKEFLLALRVKELEKTYFAKNEKEFQFGSQNSTHSEYQVIGPFSENEPEDYVLPPLANDESEEYTFDSDSDALSEERTYTTGAPVTLEINYNYNNSMIPKKFFKINSLSKIELFINISEPPLFSNYLHYLFNKKEEKISGNFIEIFQPFISIFKRVFNEATFDGTVREETDRIENLTFNLQQIATVILIGHFFLEYSEILVPTFNKNIMNVAYNDICAIVSGPLVGIRNFQRNYSKPPTFRRTGLILETERQHKKKDQKMLQKLKAKANVAPFQIEPTKPRTNLRNDYRLRNEELFQQRDIVDFENTINNVNRIKKETENIKEFEFQPLINISSDDNDIQIESDVNLKQKHEMDLMKLQNSLNQQRQIQSQLLAKELSLRNKSENEKIKKQENENKRLFEELQLDTINLNEEINKTNQDKKIKELELKELNEKEKNPLFDQDIIRIQEEKKKILEDINLKNKIEQKLRERENNTKKLLLEALEKQQKIRQIAFETEQKLKENNEREMKKFANDLLEKRSQQIKSLEEEQKKELLKLQNPIPENTPEIKHKFLYTKYFTEKLEHVKRNFKVNKKYYKKLNDAIIKSNVNVNFTIK